MKARKRLAEWSKTPEGRAKYEEIVSKMRSVEYICKQALLEWLDAEKAKAEYDVEYTQDSHTKGEIEAYQNVIDKLNEI
jgi:hypothetical protein